MKYLHERRAALGGYLPQRRRKSASLEIPPLATFERLLKDTGEREISTTMAFVQMLGTLVRDKNIGKHVVPIVPDESRTFGMEGMFRQLGIWSSLGQLYKPQDADQLMYYREAKDGQVLQEGINEGGAMSSWIVAATSYSTNNVPMIPFYIYYSMFGLQRVGDLAWLAGDIRARGFLLGGTAGRTTLNGEGLQHEDGHSHILAGDDPELHLLRPDLRLRGGDDHPRRHAPHVRGAGGRLLLHHPDERELPAPRHARGQRGRASSRACTCCSDGGKTPKKGLRVQLMGSGTILREVMAAAELLKDDFGVDRRRLERHQLQRAAPRRHGRRALEPAAPDASRARKSYVETCLEGHDGPVIASTDYMRNYADQVREYVQAAGRRYVVLGTDGFGRSDYRVKLRRFFEVDRWYVAVAALKALADDGAIKPAVVAEAIAKYGLDAERAAPWTV